MKFTLSWLKDHLETEASLDEIVTTLTRIGLEVEGVEDRAKTLSGFSIAYVISAEQHPNADKLRVCMVDTGAGEPVQVVCGAPNARAGMKSVFSPPGTYIPAKNITLAIAPVRGVESRGMLCSEFELEISNEHDGIIDLPADAPVGQSYAEYAGLSDPIIDINLTPNRPDCTGVAGIARDLAAAGLGTLKSPSIPSITGVGPCPVSVALDFGDTPTLCRGFALRLVRGVKNGSSPAWMQRRLSAIGLRPISALVDITNYVTFDQGRPLHVFDANKIAGKLVVRRARDGEEVLALDGKTYALNDTMCVIADDNGLESIAGIMGGEHSGCDENTTDVLIESALWEPLNIARTGRALGINTDARYRFERGVDPAFMVPGAELATQWVLDLCGGTPTQLSVVGETPIAAKVIELPAHEVARLTGLSTSTDESADILSRLGFGVSRSGNVLDVTVPSWRSDVEGKADLVEEVMRIVGVDTIPVTPLPRAAHVPLPVLTVLQKRTRLAKRTLAARGMMEAVTWSFVSKAQATRFGGGQPVLALANPIAADLSDMRPSLLPGLVSGGQRNADRGTGDVALFEVGQIFRGDKPEEQKIAAAGIRRSQARPAGFGRHWSAPASAATVFDVKEDVLSLLAALGAPVASFQIVSGAPSWYHPSRSGTIQLGPQNIIGWFGELHPEALESLDASGPVAGFEIILDAIPVPKPKATKTRGALSVSAFQAVKRDFAFLVDRKVRAADIVKTALGVDKKLISGASIFDVYEGKGIAEGQKSVAVEIVLQPQDRTLTDVEIDAVAAKIVAEVGKKTGATLRA